MVALASAATVTERVSLSTMVLNNELRHPAMLANEAATVAEVSDGRVRLGLGAGHASDEHHAIGLPLPPPATRVERLAESVAVIRRLLAGEIVSTDGPHYRLDRHQVVPVPSRPVPLLVGGGSRSVLRVAAEQADVVGFTGFSHVAGAPKLTHFTAAGLADRVALVREMAGERSSGLELQALVQVVAICADREAQPRAGIRRRDRGPVVDEGARIASSSCSATPDEIAAQLVERADPFGDPNVDHVQRPGGRSTSGGAGRGRRRGRCTAEAGLGTCLWGDERLSPFADRVDRVRKPVGSTSASTSCCCRSGPTCRG